MQQQPPPAGARSISAPTFYLTGRQPLRPGAILLAILVAVSSLYFIRYAMEHSGHGRLFSDGPEAAQSASGDSGSSSPDDDKDDPSQIDTIVLGDPGDAPRPARRGEHVSPVHPTILIRLPRYGDQTGLIPNSPAGQLLYDWLAAFNHADSSALVSALPASLPAAATAAQMKLRRQTGGFSLVSAREVEPGLVVFRLRDQSPNGVEVLGTLQTGSDSSLSGIESFSLRAVDPAEQDAPATTKEPELFSRGSGR